MKDAIPMPEPIFRAMRATRDFLAEEHTHRMKREHTKKGWANCKCETAKAIRFLDEKLSKEPQP